MSRTRPLSHTDYTVAWICALPTELTAAISVLDAVHPALSQNPQDNNSYTLGRIDGHNVVVVCLPAGQLGTNSAATVATQLRYSFPDVRFGLMVGIGGGAPSERHDIRLGDVVVSIPGKSSTGVIQYDFGRTVTEGRFIRDSILNAPPQILLSAVNTVRARHDMGDRHMDSVLSQGKCLSLGPKYLYQGSDQDMLFQSDYDHVGADETCIHCENGMLVSRPARESTRPRIHYGTIASGNQVMRHGKTRESCRNELDILCFEMEAAGLMNSFPCLVVRGICDYADSHKNKGWQEYAAITAAAYAKELLYAVVADRPVDRRDCLADSGSRSHQKTVSSTALMSSDETSLAGAIEAVCLDDTDFMILSRRSDWAISHRVGSGKTIVVSNVTRYLIHRPQGVDRSVFHFFYSQSYTSRLQARDLFESYIKQMISYLEITKSQCAAQIKRRIKQYYGPRGQRPVVDDILDDIFFPLSESIAPATYVVDGLDECEPVEMHKVLTAFRKIIQAGVHRIFISGREVLNVSNSIKYSTELPISSSDTLDDIRRFIDWKIDEKMRERPLTGNNDMLEEVKRRLNEKADRMILWVNLQLEMLWDECFTDADIQSAIENLPKDLNETYSLCLSRIGEVQSRVAYKVLPWLCVAAKPFKTRQLLEALAVDPITGSLERDKIPLIHDVLRCCSNLAIRDEGDQILLAHHSVRQFLHDKGDFKGRPWSVFNLKDAELGLGRLCIEHLSSPEYGRAVAAPSIAKSAIDISQVSGAVLSNFNLGFRKWGWTASRTSKPLFISPNAKPASSMAFTALPDFFHFARDQWALLTRSIDQTNPTWFKFKELALEPNFTYGLHPWESVGISLDSHYSGLLGWSINNNHLPLLKLLIDSGDPNPRADIFDLPLAGYDNHLPLHLAAKHGHDSTFNSLLPVCNPTKLDGRRRTPLHYACELGHFRIYRELIKRRPKYTAQDDQGHTALHLAAAHGHVLSMSQKHVQSSIKLKDHGGRTALSLAAMNGHQRTVGALSESRSMIDNRPMIDARDDDGRTPLMLAVMHNHFECGRILVDAYADMTVRDKQGNTALDFAMREAVKVPGAEEYGIHAGTEAEAALCLILQFPGPSSARAANLLIVLGVSPLWHDEDGNTVWHYAARNGHESVIALLNQLLVERRIMLESANHRGWLPIHEAAAQGQTGVVTLLFQNWNDPSPTVDLSHKKPDLNGSTPLHLAAQNGHAATVEALLQRQVPGVNDVNARKKTPLHLAAEEGHSSVVAALLRHDDCNVEALDLYDRTALHFAAKNGHDMTVEFLLQSGASINTGDRAGLTPLHLAAKEGRSSIVAVLLVGHANANDEASVKDPCGRTPLHFAAENGHATTVEVLLQSGASINTGDREGLTPLHLAAKEGRSSVVAVLLEDAHCNVNVEGNDGDTPLHSAILGILKSPDELYRVQTILQMVLTLLLSGANVNPVDNFGWTPLHSCMASDLYIDITMLLLRWGAIINVISRSGHTPLHMAAEAGSKLTVRTLLTRADIVVNMRTRGGKTPWDLATKNEHHEVADLIKCRLEAT